MIIVKLFGGLGNQMFQYAFSRTLSFIKKDPDIRFDIEWFETNKVDTKRYFALDIFGIEKNFASITDLKKLKNSNGFFTRVLRKITKNRLGYKKTHFTDASFDLMKALSQKNIYLDGYWQKEKYFSEIKDNLNEIFEIKKQLPDSVIEAASLIKSTDSVSLHVRRGDYVSDQKTFEFHGVCDLSYYQKACEAISKKIKNPSFFVFSDDIAWCKANLKLENAYFMDFEKNDYSDLFLMSLCKGNVIANSSFSYWGAYLNKNPDKIVISPKKWFKNEEADKKTEGLIPKSWIRID